MMMTTKIMKSRKEMAVAKRMRFVLSGNTYICWVCAKFNV
jgi:hypothetical protein